MQPMGLNELREKYLAFFESKGHLRLPSAPLVPDNDPSLLLINSGMAPLKNYFTGVEAPPRNRVTTCQKCIRTPDIDNVGKTARHGTFFEMLGNFSFGDYFKKEATAWAWEFVTEIIKIPTDRLWVTVYQEDDEAENIWADAVGVPRERIVRLGKADNFWEHGTGPCGPCSEIYYDRGEDSGCGSPDCKVGCDCDRYMEFWNLVFTQFSKDEAGNYTPLAHPNIDTGMGLERLAVIMQGVDNLFEVDTVDAIIKNISTMADSGYNKGIAEVDVAYRAITDHIRSSVFMIGDGVFPSNEGRGYVLRRLIRRAVNHGRLLGIRYNFLAELGKVVIEQNKSAYPELSENAVSIYKTIQLEENTFRKTLNNGYEILNKFIDDAKENNIKTLSGEIAFKLYDTYGFPLDLTRSLLEERGMSVGEEEFHKYMQEQRERARNARNTASSWDNVEGKQEKKEESLAHARAHSATHLLHAALRQYLGEHVTQKGSFVGDDRLRFDFSHYEPISLETLAQIENTVNENILRAMPSTITNIPIDEARKMGAMALFSEKYGDIVRVVQLGDASIELCSGRHVENTGNIGLFHINSETGSAAGIRRIDASVGLEVLGIIDSLNSKLAENSEKSQNEIKELRREIKQLKSNNIGSSATANTQEINGISVSSLKLETSDLELLRSAADNLKSKHPISVVVVGGADDNGLKFVVTATPDAIEKGAHSGNIVRDISAIAGGRGGGKPNFAQAGGMDISKIDEALNHIFSLIG
ncbi:hypothetical protein FACS189425_09850 [Clostridia bacterium]|nr:hypothetical protein FACS189425_09850 [Clostridia bacterium]